jgi:hypothetical protein
MPDIPDGVTARAAGGSGKRSMVEPAGWSTAREALRLVARPAHLHRTLLTAAIVGTILFAINQLDVVLGGRATWATWVKGGVTYLVPFAVANVGVLIGTRQTKAGLSEV